MNTVLVGRHSKGKKYYSCSLVNADDWQQEQDDHDRSPSLEKNKFERVQGPFSFNLPE